MASPGREIKRLASTTWACWTWSGARSRVGPPSSSSLFRKPARLRIWTFRPRASTIWPTRTSSWPNGRRPSGITGRPWSSRSSLRQPGNEARALNNLGYIYSSLGDWENAVRQFRLALGIDRRLRDRLAEARTLINIGDALRGLKRLDEARQSFDQALALGRGLKDPEVQTLALANSAFLATKRGHPAEAVEPARQAVRLAQGFPDREANALFALGKAHRELGEVAAARNELGKALSLVQGRGDRYSEAQIALALARAEQDSGNLTAALDLTRSAVDTIESIRTHVSDQGLRTSFLATRQDFYEAYIDLLMTTRSPERKAEALQVSERARARSLLDLLNESGANIHGGVSPALIEREHSLRTELNARDSYRSRLLSQEKTDRKKLEEAERRLEEALDQYRELLSEVRENNPGYAALTQPQPLSVAEIQGQLLDSKALLLEYELGTKRSFLWVVTPDSVQTFELPGRDRIEGTARRYYGLVTARNETPSGESLQARKQRIDHADAEAERLGRELYRLLLAPAKRLLKDRPLLIVADGALPVHPLHGPPHLFIGRSLGNPSRGGEPPFGFDPGRTAARGEEPVPGVEGPRALRRSGLRGDRRTTDSPAHRPAKSDAVDVSDSRRLEPSRCETGGRGASFLPASPLLSQGGPDDLRALASRPGLPGHRICGFALTGHQPRASPVSQRPFRYPWRARQPPSGALETGLLPDRREREASGRIPAPQRHLQSPPRRRSGRAFGLSDSPR